jgi:hypothetical protein
MCFSSLGHVDGSAAKAKEVKQMSDPAMALNKNEGISNLWFLHLSNENFIWMGFFFKNKNLWFWRFFDNFFYRESSIVSGM